MSKEAEVRDQVQKRTGDLSKDEMGSSARPGSSNESIDAEKDLERDTKSPDAGKDAEKPMSDLQRTETNRSIAERLPLWREALFVAIICMAQLLTQAGLVGTLATLHIVGDHFGITDPGVLSWFIAGYSLTVGTFIFLAGRFGDFFGYKNMLIIGYLWFALWSLIAGLSVWSNHVLFIFARVFSGIGPAICLPNGLAVLGAAYNPGKRKDMVFAIFGATAPGGAVLGATFYSLWALVWWPWGYWVFAIILVVVAFAGQLFIPSPPRKIQKKCGFLECLVELDLLGGAMGVLALVLFNFAWNQAPIVGWQKAYIIVTLCLGVAFAALFFYIEIKIAKNPLIPFEVLNSDVAFVLACVGLGWSSFGVFVYYSWQFFEVIRGTTPLLATAYFSPVPISGACASIMTGFVLSRMRPAWVMTIAMFGFLVGLILVGTAGVHESYWAQIFVSMLITPIGMDMSFPAGTLLLSNSLPKAQQGVAASLVNTVVNYSISIGLGIAGTVEVHVNHGGTNLADTLFGYRAAFWVGFGLSGLGVIVSLTFLLKGYIAEWRGEKKISTAS